MQQAAQNTKSLSFLSTKKSSSHSSSSWEHEGKRELCLSPVTLFILTLIFMCFPFTLLNISIHSRIYSYSIEQALFNCLPPSMHFPMYDEHCSY